MKTGWYCCCSDCKSEVFWTTKYLDSMFIEVKFNKRNSYYLDGEKITFENLYRRITA